MISSATHSALNQRLSRIWFFFPIQLLVLHAKKNLFLLIFWLLLFGYTAGFLGARYGVDHLFLFPLYKGVNDPLSFFILGFTIGGFILAFNLYSYILHGFRFPFIATLNRPFLKFTYNNFILPASFLLLYLVMSFRYQRHEELLELHAVLFNLGGLLAGVFFFSVLAHLYFVNTNQSAKKIYDRMRKRDADNMVTSTLHKQGKWYPSERKSRAWRVETYMATPFSIKLARDSEHYDHRVLERVFSQNHINASILEIVLILTFVLIGSFSGNEWFVIPAAASAFIFFSMLLMLISALFSWIRGWTVSVLVGLLVLINFTYDDYGLFNRPNKAYGINYDAEPAEYSRDYIYQQNYADSLAFADIQHGLKMLEQWKSRQEQDKPPLVLIQCSGGGTRSSLWTYATMARMDSLLGSDLMRRTFMITGSSGGMYGAAYYRELKWRQEQGLPVNAANMIHHDEVARDLLNPVLFSMATNDFFIRYRHYEYKGQTYTRDRASAFEDRMNLHTQGVLDKPMGDYSLAEARTEIPWMIMTPTITNDGRRLIVSSQPASYLTQNEASHIRGSTAVPEDVEFRRLFADHNPDSLRFTSAIRMNATFPYILPTVSLPSTPEIELMDAGLRDNFGMKTTIQLLYTFREWIEENTSKVVIIQIRDLQKDFSVESEGQTLVGQFTAPLGTVYGNFTRMQDFEHDEHMRYMQGWLDKQVNVVAFSLNQNPEEKISLSWHLTKAEKLRIYRKVNSEDFSGPFDRLKRTLESELVQEHVGEVKRH